MSTKKPDDWKFFLMIIGFIIIFPIIIAIFWQLFFVLLFLGFIFFNPKDKNSILWKILNEKILEFVKENIEKKTENILKSENIFWKKEEKINFENKIFTENILKNEKIFWKKEEKINFDNEIILLEDDKKITFENKIFTEKKEKVFKESIIKKFETKSQNHFKEKILAKKSETALKKLEKNSIKNVKTPSVFDNYVSVLELMKK